MPTTRRTVLTATGLAGLTHTVLNRMEADYASHDRLQPSTVTAMYATYVAHTGAFACAVRTRAWPVPLPATPARTIGGALAGAGAAVAIAGMVPFDSPAQISGTETGALHATGIYRFTRNPQYLGIVTALGGAAVAARSGFAGLLATGTWAAFRRWIPTEERHLHRSFGSTYDRYAATVNRWLTLPRTAKGSRHG